MKNVLEVILVFAYIFLCTKAYDAQDSGDPLFLTNFINSKNIQEGRKKARVEHPEMKNITSYAGYLTINKLYNSNTFFWYFPSQGSPQNDPLLVWMNGGPGSTSLLGLFALNGPFTVTENETLEIRKYSWHANHNIIYIDNPVGAGFSFTENDLGYVRSQEEVGRDVLNALIQFFKLFPELKENDFYITGESYAGKYIPAVCKAIKTHNQKVKSRINLKGLAIGNGIIDPINQLTYISEFWHNIGLIDSHEEEQIKAVEEKFVSLMGEKKYTEAADEFEGIFGPSLEISLFKNMTGFDFEYNFLQTKEPEVVGRYENWLIKPKSRKAMHVGNIAFNKTSRIVKQYLKSDFGLSMADVLADLLEDYKVLIYNGHLDLVITYKGTDNLIKKLKWSGAEYYRKAHKKQWWVGNKLAGYAKTVKNLNFVLVRNAGHYVPNDQPLWAWDLITRFTRGIGF